MTRIKLTGLVCTAVVVAFGFAASSAASAETPSAAPALTDKADVIKASAACVGPNAVSTRSIKVDGAAPVSSGGFVQGSDTVTVNFTVAAGCDPTQFGLAIYENPVDTASPTFAQIQSQELKDSDLETKSGGQSHTLSVDIPDTGECRFQVDFFTGNLITQFGAAQGYYSSPEARLIAVLHLQNPDCEEVLNNEVTTTTVGKTVVTAGETTSTTTSSTSSTTSTTTPVGGSQTDRLPPTFSGNQVPTTVRTAAATATTAPQGGGELAGAQVGAENLARTGTEAMGLATLGGALALAGGALTAVSSAVRRRRTAYRGRHQR